MAQPLHLIYITGLGDTKAPRGQLWAVARWAKYGVEAELFQMRWGDKEDWQPKYARLLARIDELLKQGKAIGLVGASAGASAAINVFAARQDKLVGVVLIAGKVNRPKAIGKVHYTENPALPQSVKQCVRSLEGLGPEARRRILSRYGLFDETVKRSDSFIPGARNQAAPTMSHFFNIAFQLTLGARSFINFLKRLNDS